MPASETTIALPPLRRSGRIDDVQIIVAGRDPNKTHRIHHHFAFFAVGFVVSGRGTYQVDAGPEQAVGSGSVFAVRPGPTYHYGPPRGESWDEYYVGVAGRGVDRWRSWGLLPEQDRCYVVADVKLAVRRFEDLFSAMRRGPDADRAVIETERLLLELRDAWLGEPAEPDELVSAVRAYVAEHFAEDIDFSRLAGRHGASYSSFRARMKQATGLPPQKYLIAVRCEKARQLLADPSLHVQEIGARVGIADPYVFSKVFKRTVGLAPREYRAGLPGRRSVRI